MLDPSLRASWRVSVCERGRAMACQPLPAVCRQDPGGHPGGRADRALRGGRRRPRRRHQKVRTPSLTLTPLRGSPAPWGRSSDRSVLTPPGPERRVEGEERGGRRERREEGGGRGERRGLQPLQPGEKAVTWWRGGTDVVWGGGCVPAVGRYSGSDLKQLCHAAAYGPLREFAWGRTQRDMPCRWIRPC